MLKTELGSCPYDKAPREKITIEEFPFEAITDSSGNVIDYKIRNRDKDTLHVLQVCLPPK
jgi:hypothetical protein